MVIAHTLSILYLIFFHLIGRIRTRIDRYASAAILTAYFALYTDSGRRSPRRAAR